MSAPRLRLTLAVVFLAVSLFPVSADIHYYNIYSLGTLGGAASYGQGVNDSGEVAGYSVTGTGETRAFLYSDGMMSDLGTLGGTNSAGYDLNESGQVTGWANTASGQEHAFLYSGGTMTDLGTVYGGSSSYGRAINDSGQVTGYGPASWGWYCWFLNSGGAMTNYGMAGGHSFGNGVNNAGQITGNVYGDQGWVYSPWNNGWTWLPTLGGNYSSGVDINDAGQVVGWASEATIGAQHAVLYAGGAPIDLGPGYASAINNHGDVLGYTGSRAFLYSGGTQYDLYDLVETGNPLNAGWTITSASDISDSGWITGTGTYQGRTYAFLMQPTPEPGSLVLLGVGLPLAGVWFRRRKR